MLESDVAVDRKEFVSEVRKMHLVADKFTRRA